MTTYIVRRLIMAFIVVIIVSLMVFFAMRILPGDPIYMLFAGGDVQEFTEIQIEKLRHQYGLDRPIIIQYFSWISDLIQGNMGTSILSHAPVSEEIIRRIPITLHIGLVSFIVGVLIGVPAGVICAVRRGTWIDTLITTLANLGITVPFFWLGVMMIYLFGLKLGWLPIQGYASPFGDFWLSLKSIIMPVICLSLFPVTSNARQARSAMLEVMRQDYIRTAWSKGLRERIVITRHALKNGLIPIVTLAGINLSIIIGGATIAEIVFNIPGLGRLLIDSVMTQDYPYVQAIILFVAVFVILVNLLVDLLYGWFDPRIRYN